MIDVVVGLRADRRLYIVIMMMMMIRMTTRAAVCVHDDNAGLCYGWFGGGGLGAGCMWRGWNEAADAMCKLWRL